MKSVIKHILFPTDFSALAHEAAEAAAQLARATGAEVSVVHVDESPLMHRYWQYMPEDRGSAVRKDVRESIAKRLAAELEREIWRGVTAERVILEGNAAFEIVGYARSKRVDLIVIPCQGESPYKENVLGGTARKVAEQAPCSVLLVRRPADLPAYGQGEPKALKKRRG